MLPRFAAVIGVAASAACSFTLNDVRPRDAGADGGDAGAVDATVADAAGDAPDAGRWCAAQSPSPAFCADFDDGTFGKGWDPHQGLTPTSPTQIREIAADAVSPPYAARFGVTATTASGSLGSNGVVRLGTLASARIAMGFDVKIESLAAGEPFALAYVFTGSYQDQSPGPDLYLWAQSLDATTVKISTLQEGVPNGAAIDWPTPIALGAWTRVRIVVTMGSPTHCTMTAAPIGGSPVVVMDADLGAPWKVDTPGFVLGVASTGTPSGAKSVLVDDLTLDAQ